MSNQQEEAIENSTRTTIRYRGNLIWGAREKISVIKIAPPVMDGTVS